MKLCTRCNTKQPLSCFGKDRSHEDGRNRYCRVCISVYSRTAYLKTRAKDARLNVDRQGLSADDVNAYMAIWRDNNRLKTRAAHTKWRLNNPAAARQKSMRRHLATLERTPVWLSKAQQAEIDGLYRFCSIFCVFQVDHTVPVRGKGVSGLHVPWNLQVIPADINRSKSNTFNPTLYPEQGVCAFMESI